MHGSVDPALAELCIFDIKNHRYFKRLRLIKQLGLLELVTTRRFRSYTRHTHSCGAEAGARTVGKRLQALTAHLAPSDPRRVHAVHVFVLRLAALTHDLGHGALSHGLDDYLAARGVRGHSHEERGVALLRWVLKDVWSARWQAAFPTGPHALWRCATALIYGIQHAALPPCMRFLVNSPADAYVDVDRLDYLPRDASLLVSPALGRIVADAAIALRHSFTLNLAHDRVLFDEPRNILLMAMRKWLIFNGYRRGDCLTGMMRRLLHRFFEGRNDRLVSMCIHNRYGAEVFTMQCVDPVVAPAASIARSQYDLVIMGFGPALPSGAMWV